MAQRNRYPGTRIDLTGLPDRPLFHDWIVEPDDRVRGWGGAHRDGLRAPKVS